MRTYLLEKDKDDVVEQITEYHEKIFIRMKIYTILPMPLQKKMKLMIIYMI